MSCGIISIVVRGPSSFEEDKWRKFTITHEGTTLNFIYVMPRGLCKVIMWFDQKHGLRVSTKSTPYSLARRCIGLIRTSTHISDACVIIILHNTTPCRCRQSTWRSRTWKVKSQWKYDSLRSCLGFRIWGWSTFSLCFYFFLFNYHPLSTRSYCVWYYSHGYHEDIQLHYLTNSFNHVICSSVLWDRLQGRLAQSHFWVWHHFPRVK